MRHVGGERRVAAFVGGYLHTVHPDRGAVVYGAEVEQETLVIGGRVLESASVPDDVVEGRLADAGELRLVAEGDGDLAVEGRMVRAESGSVSVLPASCEAYIGVVKGKAPLAVQVGPGLAAELRTRVLGTRWGRLYLHSLLQPVAPDDVRVPAGARFGDASLRSVLHEHDPEPFGVPLGPLEVIQERPDHVATQVDALLHRFVGGPEVGVEVRDALLIVHAALGVYVVVDGPTVLGHVDGHVGVIFLYSNQNLRQAFRLHGPAHSGLLRLMWHDGAGSEVGKGYVRSVFPRRVADGVAEIVVDAQKVEGNGDPGEVPVVNEREVHAAFPVIRKHVLRVIAVKQGGQVEPVRLPVHPACGLPICFTVS